MRQLAILVLVVSFATSPAQLAGKPKKKKTRDEASVTVVFTDGDRNAARLYFVEKYGRGNCPPGLAKKNDGCLPPGQAKKRYIIGQRLPPEVVFIEPSVVLTARLRPCPAGYRYVVVDGDLVKLAIGTMLVVDAIEGFAR